MLREIAFAEATAEITRLETANEYAFGELAKLRAEIERLRAELRAVLLHVAEVRAQRNEQQP